MEAAVDIAIDPKVLQRRLWQAWGRMALVAISLAFALLLFRYWLTPSVARADLRVAVVERGAVSTEVAASGVVVPKNERVLISPVTSTVEEVYAPLGSSVTAGTAILKLDSTAIERDLTRLRDELRLKDLEIEGLKQQQQQALRELHNQQALAAIDFQNHKITLSRYEKLSQANIVSEYEYDKTVLEASKSELQLQQLSEQIAATLAADANTRAQHEVARQLLAQQLAEQQRLLHSTTLHAGSAGIITVLMSELGQNVAAGSELARISDTSSYRIDATLSDFYLQQISTGMPASIDLGSTTLTGHLSQILPAIDNGTIGLQIELDDPANAQLKSNLRVEAGIITEQRGSGVRVSNGIVFNGPGVQRVFVLQEREAVQREVEVGLINGRHVEIRSGLAAGEQIIISDMGAWQHLERIAITD